MKVCILSDSHDHIPLIDAAVADAKAAGAEAVLHCGDLVAPSTLNCLQKYGRPLFLACSADLAGSTKIGRFQKDFPERFINLGVAEMNMMGMASGLASVGFIPVRKPGKLPADTLSASYDLEYGTDALELHAESISEGDRVLVHDDVLATGGTARAMCDLIEQLGGEVVQCNFLIELGFLKGREKLDGYPLKSLIIY